MLNDLQKRRSITFGNPVNFIMNLQLRYFFLLSIFIFFLRIMPQFLNPQLWAEDLTMLKVVESGNMFSTLAAMSGQSIWVSFLPVFLGSFKLLLLPQILLASSISMYILTLVVFLRIDSNLLNQNAKKFFVVLVALIPVYPEAFGVNLYNFWWLSIWPISVIYSKQNKNQDRLKILVILISSLSSLAGAFLCLFLLLRAIFEKSSYFLRLFVFSIPGICLQTYVYTSTPRNELDLGLWKNYIFAPLSLIGDYFLGIFTLPSTWLRDDPRVLQFLVSIFFIVLVLMISKRFDVSERFALRSALAIPFVLSVLTVQARPDQVWDLHPYAAGQRYFFLPWLSLIALFSILLFSSQVKKLEKFFFITCVLISLSLLVVSFSRIHPTQLVDWESDLVQCFSSYPTTKFYAQSDGVHELWTYDFESDWCKVR